MNSNGQPDAPPTIRRRNHGGGRHSYYVDDVKLPGATKVLGDGFPKFLEAWAARSSADYAVNNWDDLAAMPITERRSLIEKARFDDRDTAARRGQDVHALAHRLALGEEVEVPEELAGHVDAYMRFVEDWDPRELYVEATVANLRRGYCGTLDVIADLVDKRRWLYDVKTTRSGVFVEAALQVAAYRYAEWIVVDDAPEPMPDVDACGVLWLRADGTYQFVEVAAGDDEFVVFLYALGISRFRQRDDVLLDAFDGPPTARVGP